MKRNLLLRKAHQTGGITPALEARGRVDRCQYTSQTRIYFSLVMIFYIFAKIFEVTCRTDMQRVDEVS